MRLYTTVALVAGCLFAPLSVRAQERGVTVGVGASLGAPVGHTDNANTARSVSNYTGWVAPLEAWAAYRFHPQLEVGASGSIGPALTAPACANGSCSGSVSRAGLLLRGSVPLRAVGARLFAAAGPGWEWLHQSSGEVETLWSGPTFLNVQTGLVLGAENRFHFVPLISASLSQFRTLSAWTDTRSASAPIAYPGLHFLVTLGVRFEAEVLGHAPPSGPLLRVAAGQYFDSAVVQARSLPVLVRSAPVSAVRRAQDVLADVADARRDLATAPPNARISTENAGPLTIEELEERLDALERQAREAIGQTQ